MGKLNDNEKEIIGQLIKEGYPQQKVANFFDVSQPTISITAKKQRETQIGKEPELSLQQESQTQNQKQETTCPVHIENKKPPHCPISFS